MKRQNSVAPYVMRIKDIPAYIQQSRSSVYNKINPKSKYFDPDFPKPVRIGKNSVGFIIVEIDAWLQSCKIVKTLEIECVNGENHDK